jgi:hypothetical protein
VGCRLAVRLHAAADRGEDPIIADAVGES